jgi:hypothetical protein
MKVIISHDIDHFYWSDHFFKDLFIPKYIFKNTLFFLRGQIPLSLFWARLSSFSSNRFSRLKELVEFNKNQGIPSTFFMGVNNALNLSYSQKTARFVASFLKESGLPLHLHGIAYNQLEKMKEEQEKFRGIVPTAQEKGIRMHYLRNSVDTLNYIARLGYDFDSTLYELKKPFLVANTVEFPVSMMEVYMMQYNDTDFEKIKILTEQRIAKAMKLGLEYFTVIFHDHHFSDSFPIHKKWYEWLILHFKERNFEFTDFIHASREVRVSQSKTQ